MRLSYIFSLSFKNLRNRKLRSFLTIGGMAIGIGSIVFLVSLGFGLQQLVVSQVTDVEALTVLDVSTGTSTLLTVDNNTINEFKKLDKVVSVSPSMNLSGQGKNNELVTDVVVYAIDPQFIAMEGVHIMFGENFKENEEETIVSSTLADLLGFKNSQDILGKTISYQVMPPHAIKGEKKETSAKNIELKVVGMIEDSSPVGYIPLLVAGDLGFKDYNLVRIKLENQKDITEVRAKLESMGFQVDSVADTVGQIDKIFALFQIVMGVIGFIALFIASLGTFNTLTVSLLERTREIGVMKSIGATKKDVYIMFMTESIVMGFLGTSIGVLGGTVLGTILNYGVNLLAVQYGGSHVDIFNTPLIFIAILFSAVFLMSMITGAYPAIRAGRINPLDAIRYE